ncbi:hypothetical protein SAMN06295888_1571 [Desulfonatronum zhilinae]|nr:hypothetical protein SAMN06295888_1571 [Desulfonatronum zhilinae]
MATAVQYQNKVNAYFEATTGRSATAAELALWTQNLVNTNGNVWAGLGLQQHVSQIAGLGLNKPYTTAMATALVNQIWQNMFGAGAHTGMNATIRDYYVTNLVAGTIKERGLANAVINDLGLMPKVDGTYGSPAGWVAGPAGANSPALVTAAQRLAWEDNVENASGGEFTLTIGTDYADRDGSFNGVTPDAFKFTNNNELVDAPAGTLAGVDTLIDPNNWVASPLNERDNDVLTILANRAFPVTPVGAQPIIRNIETIEIRNTDSLAGTLDFTNISGARYVNVYGTLNGQLTLANLNNAALQAERYDFGNATPSTNTSFGVTMQGVPVLPAGVNVNGLVIVGSAGNDQLIGSIGADTITSGAGNDLITTSGGANRITLNGGDNVVNVNAVTAGGEINTIIATAGSNTINMTAGVATVVNAAQSTVGLRINADAGNDTITGGMGNDIITGGAGADTINLVGGANTIRYTGNTTALLGAEGGDIITGFNPATSQLQFANLTGTTGFAAGTAANPAETLITSAAGAAGNVNFVSAAGAVAVTAQATFAYDTATGVLTFDADGTGAGAAIVIATFTGVPPLTAADFVLG